MPKKTKIDIGSLSADAQAVILKQVQQAATAKEEADAKKFKVEVEAYYTLKAQLEKQLEKSLSGALGKAHFSPAKKLKVIASLPTKKPTTAAGYIKAHNAIATGKVGARKRVAKEESTLIVETKDGEVKASKVRGYQLVLPKNDCEFNGKKTQGYAIGVPTIYCKGLKTQDTLYYIKNGKTTFRDNTK